MDVKAELQYRLVIDLLERMTREGLLKSGELTRAKRLVVVVGREACMRQMVDNNLIRRRYSALTRRLRTLEEA